MWKAVMRLAILIRDRMRNGVAREAPVGTACGVVLLVLVGLAAAERPGRPGVIDARRVVTRRLDVGRRVADMHLGVLRRSSETGWYGHIGLHRGEGGMELTGDLLVFYAADSGSEGWFESQGELLFTPRHDFGVDPVTSERRALSLTSFRAGVVPKLPGESGLDVFGGVPGANTVDYAHAFHVHAGRERGGRPGPAVALMLGDGYLEPEPPEDERGGIVAEVIHSGARLRIRRADGSVIWAVP